MQNIAITICIILLCTTVVCSQTFQDIGNRDLKGGYLGFASFVDYNSDGYDDVFVTGLDFDNRFVTNEAVFYQNNGDFTFTESTIGAVPRVIYGDYDWADFDNNGTLDLLYSGTTSGFSEFGIAKVFRNTLNGCDFVELPLNLPGITEGASRWVDINADGLLDVFLLGFDVNDAILITSYVNNGDGTFIQQALGNVQDLPGGRGNFSTNTARWGDFDNDGLNDVVIAVSTELGFYLRLYRNLGNFQFEETNIGLPQLSYVAMELGDVDNDGRIDIVFTGSPNTENSSGDGTGDFYVFTNNGNMNFTNSFTIADEGVFWNDIALGDMDNDGFLDAINYGTGPVGNFPEITKIYRNNQNGTFSEIAHSLPECRFGGVDLADFDNDNDLDLLYFGRIEDPSDNEITYIYENIVLDESLPTEILTTESCACDNTMTFSLNNETDAIQWNFGDPLSGALNTSTEKNPSHTFTDIGTYTVTASYTVGAVTNTLTVLVEISGLPLIEDPEDIVGCNNGETLTFNFNDLKDAEILNGAPPEDFEVYYYESLTNAQDDAFRIQMPYTYNPTVNTIHVRVQNTVNLQCFVLTDFQVSLGEVPPLDEPEDLGVCDEDEDGFAFFDLNPLATMALAGLTNVSVSFYDSMGALIPIGIWGNYQNAEVGNELITIRLTNDISQCFSESEFSLVAYPLPLANPVPDVIGCDENGDGISELFDTSDIESTIVGNQENMVVTYFDSLGNPITLSNPYTNTTPNEEILTAQITNTTTGCSSETTFVLRTTEIPELNPVPDLGACEVEEGFAFFDTTQVVEQLIGNQIGFEVTFQDIQGNPINDFISTAFRNQTANEQTIVAIVQSGPSSSCSAETNFRLLTSPRPQLGLEDSYALCDLEPSLTLMVPEGFLSYEWLFEDGTQIAASSSASIALEGNYTLTITDDSSGITCEWNYTFQLLRSDLPSISDVEFSDLMGNNFIRILANGDGDFEYSIDGITYFDSNLFTNVLGGAYTVYVRDKNGCGEDSESVVLIDYPRFFSPNGDNTNETWHILNPEIYPELQLEIFDRYGKLIAQLNSSSLGWDGEYNGFELPSSDYWFIANLGNGRSFNGHFSLKR